MFINSYLRGNKDWISQNYKLSFETLQNIFAIKILEEISCTVFLIPNILIKENKTAFQFLPAKAASSSLSDPYCNAIVIADKRSPWADLLLLQKKGKKERKISEIKNSKRFSSSNHH